MRNNRIYVVLSVMWIATSAAVIAGLYFTHSKWCLLALLIPANIRVRTIQTED
jgi:hypothetical protein